MNKKELIDSIANQTGYPKNKINNVLKAYELTIKSALEQKQNVKITDFGTFTISHRKSREGRNPSTGEKMTIPEQIVPVFKFSKNVKSLCN
jgi:DNA-binding protein HU-beta